MILIRWETIKEVKSFYFPAVIHKPFCAVSSGYNKKNYAEKLNAFEIPNSLFGIVNFKQAFHHQCAGLNRSAGIWIAVPKGRIYRV
jgi:hypothetical protein